MARKRANTEIPWWQYQLQSLFFIFPPLTLISVIIILSAPIHIPETFAITQAFLIENIFYYAIWCPAYLSSPLVFLLGLLFDLTHALPMGISAFLFLVLYYFCKATRFSFMQMHFVIGWICATLLGTFFAFLEWAIMSLAHLHFFNITHILLEGMLAMGIYPLIFAIMSRIMTFLNPDETS